MEGNKEGLEKSKWRREDSKKTREEDRIGESKREVESREGKKDMRKETRGREERRTAKQKRREDRIGEERKEERRKEEQV